MPRLRQFLIAEWLVTGVGSHRCWFHGSQPRRSIAMSGLRWLLLWVVVTMAAVN